MALKPQSVKLVSVPNIEMVAVLHESDAVGGSKVQAEAQSTALSAAQVIAGGVVSTTVTVWLHWEEFPQASVALHVRVAAKPQFRRLVVVLTIPIIAPLQLSAADGASKFHGCPHSTVLLAEQVMRGAFVS
ncbi:MAG TPA: hypothetical protein VK530_15845 [Candidatus Acidoferrum sp.]|nr:hypothetical protein [Candidatus Acidoferrum sp.]